MHPFDWPLLWAAMAGIAASIAAFGALVAGWFSWRTHRHERMIAGHRKPVKIGRSNGALLLEKPPMELGLQVARYALVFVFNRSNVAVASRPSADHLRDQLAKTECPGCPR